MSTTHIVNSTSAIIANTLATQKQEESYPSRDADAMDDKIKGCKDRVKRLRALREDFEDIMSEVI